MLLIAPAALALAFLSGEKQQYLSDPLYPSDLLFARQIKGTPAGHGECPSR
jgi:hypothetical protein